MTGYILRDFNIYHAGHDFIPAGRTPSDIAYVPPNGNTVADNQWGFFYDLVEQQYINRLAGRPEEAVWPDPGFYIMSRSNISNETVEVPEIPLDILRRTTQNENENNSTVGGTNMITITKEKLNEVRLMTKFVTANLVGLHKNGIQPFLDKYYPKEEAAEAPVKDEELEAKIETMRKTLDGNDYGCQEDRTRRMFGIMLANNPNLFLKGSAGSTEMSFQPGDFINKFIGLIIIRTRYTEDYRVGLPVLMSMSDRRCIDMTGESKDQMMTTEDLEQLNRSGTTSDSGHFRVATPEEIDTLFQRIEMNCEVLDGSGNLSVADDFPLLTGNLGRSMRKILEVYPDGVGYDEELNA